MTSILIDLHGATETIAAQEGVQARMQHASPAFRRISDLIQAGEVRVFSGGKYVRTGDLKAALTQPDASNKAGEKISLRDIHADGAGLTFGAHLWYAHFLKDQNGKSAVLKLQPKERKAAKQILLDWILGHGQLA